jgi:hypothetical protein
VIIRLSGYPRRPGSDLADLHVEATSIVDGRTFVASAICDVGAPVKNTRQALAQAWRRSPTLRATVRLRLRHFRKFRHVERFL